VIFFKIQSYTQMMVVMWISRNVIVICKVFKLLSSEVFFSEIIERFEHALHINKDPFNKV